ncbi:hypothetical protein E2C01_051034 [Portunus trituberculatus]|uniref:Uncharacterized protein n=1 Tax=Portunus trituberculatus TaxID=210409 RepID=A0A5B7GDP1_PORTR|nr:hypothetical protein [Portunus trituberculatus]
MHEFSANTGQGSGQTPVMGSSMEGRHWKGLQFTEHSAAASPWLSSWGLARQVETMEQTTVLTNY